MKKAVQIVGLLLQLTTAMAALAAQPDPDGTGDALWVTVSLRPDRSVQGFGLMHTDARIERDAEKNSEYVTILAAYESGEDARSFVHEGETLRPDGAGHLRIRAPLERQDASVVSLVAVDIRGRTEPIEIAVRRIKPEASTWALTPGVAYTALSYSSAGGIDYSSQAMTGKVSFSKALSPRWVAGGNVFGTALVLAKSDATSVRFLGVNGRVGYVAPILAEPWKLVVFGGYYALSMNVTEDRFGFSGVSGPQLFPVVRRQLSRTAAISAYLKLSLVTDRTAGFVDFGNRELAIGGQYEGLLLGRRVAATVDFSDLSLRFLGGEQSLRTISFGLALPFSY